ncbi:hypothetical protein A3Q56_02854 [Intoshia linei]|uniref:MSP domain-containing protein n=1 Tax=Intoshia linei TaxID=1819745 RepID=A0A177B513_9BILA|nr:hypothetical protein A3Q56_02854 [Intoshia linei]
MKIFNLMMLSMVLLMFLPANLAYDWRPYNWKRDAKSKNQKTPMINIKHGLEFTKNVTWKDWKCGKIYKRFIYIKNISINSVNIEVKSPKSQFFESVYPNKYIISPGNEVKIPVVFKPLNKMLYNDNMTIITQSGELTISLRVNLPTYKLNFNKSIHFSNCIVDQENSIIFKIKNMTHLITHYKMTVEKPFNIKNNYGVLNSKNEVSEIIITFLPTTAKMYDVSCIIRYGSEDLKYHDFFNMSATSKYAHLTFRSKNETDQVYNDITIVDFGKVCVGKVMSKSIFVRNYSDASVRTHINKKTMYKSCFYTSPFYLDNGTIDVTPFSEEEFKIKFIPTFKNRKYFEIVNLISNNGTKLSQIYITGSSVAPRISVNENFFNFGVIPLNNKKNIEFYLINQSDTSSYFQLYNVGENDESFNVSCSNGTIDRLEKKRIIINFCPRYPINYYRKIFILVSNQNTINMHVFGSSYSNIIRPLKIETDHVLKYLNHCKNYSSHFGEMGSEYKLVKPPISNDELIYEEACDNTLFKMPYITISETILMFNLIKFKKTFYISNHTNETVNVYIFGQIKNFILNETKFDIQAQSSIPIQVTFRALDKKIIENTLQLYISYKSQMDYNYNQDNKIIPPWHKCVVCIGTIFDEKNMYVPNFSLDKEEILFQPLLEPKTLYETLVVKNDCNTNPLLVEFEFDQSSDSNNLMNVIPKKRLIPKNGLQIFIISKRQNSDEIKQNLQYTLKATFNNRVKHLNVYSPTNEHVLKFNKDSPIYFNPTTVNHSTIQKIGFFNASLFPVKVSAYTNAKEIQFISKYVIVKALTPSNLYLKFTPSNIGCKMYLAKLQVNYQFENLDEYDLHSSLYENNELNPVRDDLLSAESNQSDSVLSVLNHNSCEKKIEKRLMPTDSIKTHFLSIITKSVSTNIKVSQDTVLFKNIIVNQISYKTIRLVNLQVGSVSIQLQLDCKENDLKEMNIYPKKIVLYPYVPCEIVVEFAPIERKLYNYTLNYKIDNKEANIENSKIYKLCEINAISVFPLIKITSIRGYGIAQCLSIKELKKYFNLIDTNNKLEKIPEKNEYKYNFLTRVGYDEYLDNSNDIDTTTFNFVPAPINSENCTIKITLENIGVVPLKWSFMTLGDLRIKQPMWMKNDNLNLKKSNARTDIEIFDQNMQDETKMKMLLNIENLFLIEPKLGSLKPAESVTVKLTYAHAHEGTHILPVLFKIEQGREMTINFIGRTVSINRPYLFFDDKNIKLQDVAIGYGSSPIQNIAMYNGGNVELYYNIDLKGMDEINKKNYNQLIFTCLTASGYLKPGYTDYIKIKFMPIEEKMYWFTLPVNVDDVSIQLTISANGYFHKSVPPVKQLNNLIQTQNTPKYIIDKEVVYLSTDKIEFDSMQLFGVTRRLIFLYNRKLNDKIIFSWHVTNKSDSKYVYVTPNEGIVEANSFVSLKITFVSYGEPSFYNIDLICETINMDDMNTYEMDLDDWEKNKIKQKYEFDITEKDLNADEKIGPLKNSESCDSNDKYMDFKPKRPNPLIIHFTVNARTCIISDYKNCEKTDNSIHSYVDKLLTTLDYNEYSEQTQSIKEKISAACPLGVYNTVGIILNNTILSILYNKDFKNLITSINDEHVPYYAQISKMYNQKVKGNSQNIEIKQYDNPSGVSAISQIELINLNDNESIIDDQEMKMNQFKNKFYKKQKLKKYKEIGTTIEYITENCISNLLQEYINKDCDLINPNKLICVKKKKQL